ncbi:MAG: hypothetical protein JSW06_02960 [Thermoplasmatales archaeon]|nr:MAG: hypothetical protein JSW06_02960 [Thermoplasmatales archaeon]
MTKKYEARIMVEYRFTFESDKTSRKELEEEAERKWDAMSEVGMEGEKYHDTEVNVAIS